QHLRELPELARAVAILEPSAWAYAPEFVPLLAMTGVDASNVTPFVHHESAATGTDERRRWCRRHRRFAATMQSREKRPLWPRRRRLVRQSDGSDRARMFVKRPEECVNRTQIGRAHV